MQSKTQKYLAAILFAMALVSVTLFSFSPRPGGDHFEIYLNKKLVLQQMVSHTSNLKSLALDNRNVNDKVDVFYSHCGQIGSKRTIAIKEGKNVLKQWRFSDASGDKKFMSVEAKDILAFRGKNTDRKINLYYSSEEIPEGKLLATIILDTDHIKTLP